MKNTLLVTLALCANSAQAALPPGAESLRRIAAIASSQEVYKKIGNSGWISSVSDNGNGTYNVVSSSCVLTVQIKVKNREGMVGPGELVIVPGQLNCLPNN